MKIVTIRACTTTISRVILNTDILGDILERGELLVLLFSLNIFLGYHARREQAGVYDEVLFFELYIATIFQRAAQHLLALVTSVFVPAVLEMCLIVVHCFVDIVVNVRLKWFTNFW